MPAHQPMALMWHKSAEIFKRALITPSLDWNKNMFEELNELLESYAKKYELVSEFWSVDGSVDALDIIRDFQEEDWTKLAKSLKSKGTMWKTLLAEILVDKDNPHTLEILNMLINTNDKRLFTTIVCRLNSYDPETIKNKDYVIEKINEFMPDSSKVDRFYYDAFLQRVNKNCNK